MTENDFRSVAWFDVGPFLMSTADLDAGVNLLIADTEWCRWLSLTLRYNSFIGKRLADLMAVKDKLLEDQRVIIASRFGYDDQVLFHAVEQAIPDLAFRQSALSELRSLAEMTIRGRKERALVLLRSHFMNGELVE